tara:strand:+ start:195 stop:395 length:201 start_codon:yes stop_codon:yes gene_type:complete
VGEGKLTVQAEVTALTTWYFFNRNGQSCTGLAKLILLSNRNSRKKKVYNTVLDIKFWLRLSTSNEP